MTGHILNTLYEILLDRKNADGAKSYVASLYQKGTAHIADKITEEAAEIIVEALKGDQQKLKQESADLLFHLMVLWADQDITPDQVFSILEQRLGVGGHAEKASRKTLVDNKIP